MSPRQRGQGQERTVRRLYRWTEEEVRAIAEVAEREDLTESYLVRSAVRARVGLPPLPPTYRRRTT